MRFEIDGLDVFFPYDYLYKEQYEYMVELKRALDAKGHCLLEMPTGTGKTVCLISLITSYQFSHPEMGKFIYCTRTVPEMVKCVEELKRVMSYRASELRAEDKPILALCLSSRRNLCINERVMRESDREAVDSACRNMTASWVRQRAGVAWPGRNGGRGGRGNRNGASSNDDDDYDPHLGVDDDGLSAATAAATRGNGDNGDNGGNGGNGGGNGDGGGGGNGDGGGGGGGSDDGVIIGGGGLQLCEFYEQYDRNGSDAVMPPGIYSLEDLKVFGRQRTWCPYFLARHVINHANVLVYNYQYMLDPKVAGLVSRELEAESVVVFDEAHNIDNVCTEALSVTLDRRGLDAAGRCLGKLSSQVNNLKASDQARLNAEYARLVNGLAQDNAQVGGAEGLLANPALPADILQEAVPGNIRRAEHFVAFMRKIVEHLKTRVRVQNVESETPLAFLHRLQQQTSLEAKPLRFAYSRLNSLLRTLEITGLDEYNPLQAVADFATLVSTYKDGFAVVTEPNGSVIPGVYEPVMQLTCLDSSLAIKPVLERFQSVIITSGTLSPIDLYPKLLGFSPVVRASLPMSTFRACICPLVVTRGSDQLAMSTKFDLREDPSVVRNYGSLLVELAGSVPDGIVGFFTSYSDMEQVVTKWDAMGVLKRVLEKKLVFIETKDVVETTLALDNFKRACDCGRGAIFFSVARGKVAEGIDFDRHYGRAVVLFGVPFQYTLSHTLRARLEYLRTKFQIREGDFLTFDALRQAAQCVGRVIRSKTDYGLMVFADSRYNRHDKRSKLPQWILQFLDESHLNLSVDTAVAVTKQFLREMAQPVDREVLKTILLDKGAVANLNAAAAGQAAAAAVRQAAAPPAMVPGGAAGPSPGKGAPAGAEEGEEEPPEEDGIDAMEVYNNRDGEPDPMDLEAAAGLEEEM